MTPEEFDALNRAAVRNVYATWLARAEHARKLMADHPAWSTDTLVTRSRLVGTAVETIRLVDFGEPLSDMSHDSIRYATAAIFWLQGFDATTEMRVSPRSRRRLDVAVLNNVLDDDTVVHVLECKTALRASCHVKSAVAQVSGYCDELVDSGEPDPEAWVVAGEISAAGAAEYGRARGVRIVTLAELAATSVGPLKQVAA